jgi:hypothetical protein
MDVYDPAVGPDPSEWLELGEGERMALVAEYHRAAGDSVPSPTLHAAIHATVETQIAMGDELPVRRTLIRLMSEGLERHDAIHAIGSVLAETMYDILRETEKVGEEPNAAYFSALDHLSAKGWRQSGR